MALTAEQMVADVRDGLQVFPNDAPYVDGFADDKKGRRGTSILSRLNRKYRDFVRLGFLQCYKDVTLVIDQKERRLPSTFGFIYEVQLTDQNGRIWPLINTEKAIVNVQRPFHNNYTSRRPMSYYHIGSILGFDYAPDYAYPIKILADVLPDPLVNRADTPYQLDDVLHDCLVDATIADMATLSLKLKAPGGTQDAGIVQYNALLKKGQDAEDYVRRVANARTLNASHPPLVVDPYRGG